MNFSDIIGFLKNSYPNIWEPFHYHLKYSQEQILIEIESEIDGEQKLNILAEKRKYYFLKLQEPLVRFNIAFFDGGLDEVAKDVDAKFRREIYLNASDSKTEERQIIYLNGIKPFLDKIQKKDIKSLSEFFEENQKFIGYIAEWHGLEESKDITISNAIEQFSRPPSNPSVTQAIAGYFEIHTWQLLLQWLDETIQSFGEVNLEERLKKDSNSKDWITIEGNLDRQQISRAFDFLNEVKVLGNTLMLKEDVKRLQEVGLKLPKGGLYLGEKFKLREFSGNKGLLFSFFHTLWYSHTIKLRRSSSKEEFAIYLKTYFEDVSNLPIESILAQMKKGRASIFKDGIQKYIPKRSDFTD